MQSATLYSLKHVRKSSIICYRTTDAVCTLLQVWFHLCWH